MAVQSEPQTGSSNWLYDARLRAIFYQIATAAIFVGVVFWLTNNTIDNLNERGIATGFKFLGQPTGFGLPFYLIPYSETSTYGTAFVVSVLNTLFISFIGIVLATIIGFLFGVMRLSRNWLISKIATVYLETVRNVPLLLQILFWYFGVLQTLPQVRNSVNMADTVFLNIRGLYMPKPHFETAFLVPVILFIGAIVATWVLARWAKRRQADTGEQFPIWRTGIGLILGLPIVGFLVTGMPVTLEYPALKGFNFQGGLVLVPEFMALLAALTLYTAAFIGEIVRAGIQSVSHGQTEAAFALGLRPSVTMRLVIIPQALRVIVPPLTSQYLNLTKNSSLAAAIGYPELVAVFAGTVLNQTGQAVECILMTMAVYFTISLCISIFMNWYNKRIALVER
ncbi:MAG: amino acid ABC transporter permease [Alphaproteobacteria bacterium]